MNTKGKIFLTLFTGVLFGLPAYLILSLIDDKTAALLGVLAGALFSLFMLPFLFIYEKAMNKRAAEAEKRFESEILYSQRKRLAGDLTAVGVQNRPGHSILFPWQYRKEERCTDTKHTFTRRR